MYDPERDSLSIPELQLTRFGTLPTAGLVGNFLHFGKHADLFIKRLINILIFLDPNKIQKGKNHCYVS